MEMQGVGRSNLSLVHFEDERGLEVVRLVRWAIASVRGHTVPVDAQNRIIYAKVPMYAKYHQEQDLAHATLIHPNVGARMSKVKPHLREPLDKRVVRLWKMWEQALHSRASDASEPLRPCAQCFDARPLFGGADPVVTCGLCLLSLHPTCCVTVVEWSAATPRRAQELSEPVSAKPTELPDVFRSLCALCWRWAPLPQPGAVTAKAKAKAKVRPKKKAKAIATANEKKKATIESEESSSGSIHSDSD
jgi:hypothetical protein